MARQQKNKIIHLFETFSIQVLTFLNSERVNRILSSKNSLFERPGFNLPREPKKMLIASHQRSNPGHQNLYLKKYKLQTPGLRIPTGKG